MVVVRCPKCYSALIDLDFENEVLTCRGCGTKTRLNDDVLRVSNAVENGAFVIIDGAIIDLMFDDDADDGIDDDEDE